MSEPKLLDPPKAWADIIDRRFGRLTTLGYSGDEDQRGRKRVTCLCSCGRYVHIMPSSLRSGATTSCGCLRREQVAAKNRANVKHGDARGGKVTPEYAAWQAMQSRCLNPGDARYPAYGGRGIKVCERWRDYCNFLEDVGRRPSPAYSLERRDNDKGYEPSNVFWATTAGQVRNRRGVKFYEFNGERLTMGECAQRTSLPYERLHQRVNKYGWTLAEAIMTPLGRVVDDPRDLYGRWYQMIQRCTDPTHLRWKDYGGRGIKVCDRWLEFERFVEDVGLPPSPEAYMLDRLDNDGSYEPGNVAWRTPLAQIRNRRNTKRYVLDGWTLTLTEWAILVGADYGTTKRRVHSGWILAEALGTPRDAGRSPDVRRVWTPTLALQELASRWALDDKDAIVRRAVELYRTLGFPWHILQPETEPLQRVQRAKVSVGNDTIQAIGAAGQGTCLVFHPHRFEARHAHQPSIVEAFGDDRRLERAIRYQLDRGDPITPKRLLRALMALVRAPRNFPPALARWLVDEYVSDQGVILDPCSGYGGRLLGALASSRNVTYIGFDIEPKIVEGNVRLAEHLGCASRVTQSLRAAEGLDPWPRADLVLLGPPYYDLEDYGVASRDCLAAFGSYEAWRDGFLRELVVRALGAAPTVVVNVAHVTSRGKTLDLPADVAALAVAAGGRVDRTLAWPLRAFGKRGREEQLLILRPTR